METEIIRCWPAAEAWDLTNRKKTPSVSFKKHRNPDKKTSQNAYFSLRANTCAKIEKHSASCSFWSPVPSPPAAHSGDLMDYLTMTACPPGTCATCRHWTSSQVVREERSTSRHSSWLRDKLKSHVESSFCPPWRAPSCRHAASSRSQEGFLTVAS